MHSEEKPQRVRHNRYNFKGRIQRNPAMHTYHDDEHTQNSLGIVCNTNTRAGSESAAEEVRLFQQTDSNICKCEAENRECRRWARGQRSCPSRSCVWPQLLRPEARGRLPWGTGAIQKTCKCLKSAVFCACAAVT